MNHKFFGDDKLIPVKVADGDSVVMLDEMPIQADKFGIYTTAGANRTSEI